MRAGGLLALLILATGVGGLASVAGAAESVAYVRKDCTGMPSPCFQTVEASTDWIWGTRPSPPGPGDRVVVDVGPGSFDSFQCLTPLPRCDKQANLCNDGVTACTLNSQCPALPQRGWVTLRGAGREATRLQYSAMVGREQRGAYHVHDCKSLDVRDLTIEGDCCGVSWSGGGSSTWTNVDIFAGDPASVDDGVELGPPYFPSSLYSFAWYDSINCNVVDPDVALHYFFNSRLEARGFGNQNAGWAANCAEVWFYGGEIRATWSEEPPPSTCNETTGLCTTLFQTTRTCTTDTDCASVTSFGNVYSAAVVLSEASDFRVFGTRIRSDTGGTTTYRIGSDDSSTDYPDGPIGALILPSNVMHMHGGIIESSGEGHVDAVVTGILARDFVHAPDTAYELVPGAEGDATRILVEPSGQTLDQILAKVRTPFVWPPGNDPPDVSSVTGLDLFVEGDCAPNGDCSGGPDPHLMIYDDRCQVDGPWFDTVTGACRWE